MEASKLIRIARTGNKQAVWCWFVEGESDNRSGFINVFEAIIDVKQKYPNSNIEVAYYQYGKPLEWIKLYSENVAEREINLITKAFKYQLYSRLADEQLYNRVSYNLDIEEIADICNFADEILCELLNTINIFTPTN